MPPSPRSHRPGLTSIDDDNWEEDPPDAAAPAHYGRTVKHHSSSRGSYNEQQQQQPYSFDPYHVHYGAENVARMPPPESSRRSNRQSRSARAGESSSDDVVSSRYVAVIKPWHVSLLCFDSFISAHALRQTLTLRIAVTTDQRTILRVWEKKQTNVRHSCLLPVLVLANIVK